MYNIKVYNNISPKGLNLLDKNEFNVLDEVNNPDGVLLRSYNLHDVDFPKSLKCIARAGAGVNNIPLDKCTENGIVVFNTPGANANAVKELTIAALLLSCRKISKAIEWSKTLIGEGENVPKIVEKQKSNFAGPELKGKTLGVIGLGAIGVMVANVARAFGMEVIGYDPYISINSAWELSRNVKKAPDMNTLLQTSDFITIHVPLNKDTKDMINAESFSMMKKGVRLINISRGGLVNVPALKKAIENEIIASYVTDFIDEETLKMENVVAIPHLGASTPESEENCAIMAAKELEDFLKNGNIVNSVNFPACVLNRTSDYRLTITHKNIPNMVGQIATLIAENNINILNMVNRSKGNIAYTIIDTENKITDNIIEKLKNTDSILKVRIL